MYERALSLFILNVTFGALSFVLTFAIKDEFSFEPIKTHYLHQNYFHKPETIHIT